MDQNGEQSVLKRDNYRSSGHLSGGEEIPVEMEFHTEAKINSPSRSTREGAWLQRGRGGGEGVKGEGRSVKKANISAPTGMRINMNLGLDDGDKVSLCPHVVDLHLRWVTDGCLVAGRQSLLVKGYCCITYFIPTASSTRMSVIKTSRTPLPSLPTGGHN